MGKGPFRTPPALPVPPPGNRLAEALEGGFQFFPRQDPAGGKVGSERFIGSEHQEGHGQGARDPRDVGQSRLGQDPLQQVLLSRELFARRFLQDLFQAVRIPPDPVVSPGFHAAALDLDDHEAEVRVHDEEIQLPVPVGLRVQQAQPREDMGLRRQGPQGAQDFRLAVEMRRDARRIRVEVGHRTT